MKRVLLIFVASFLAIATVAAQDGKSAQNNSTSESHISLYGFIRNYFTYDSRVNVSGTEDFFTYLPKDRTSATGDDLNDQSSFRFAALTSRVGLNVTGYEYAGLKFGAKIETDFYSGLSGSTGTATLRLRQAFVTVGKNDWAFKIGQTWHPMAADMPDVFSLNTGAPFGPFSRTPQVTFDYKFTNALSLTASALWQMQYVSAGPNGASADYIKYSGTPELYVGLNLKSEPFLFRAGVDVLSIKPRINDGTNKVSERITTYSPFVYGQYKSGLFSAKLKSIYAQAGEHMNLNGGYGVSSINSDGSFDYTPSRNSSTWVSLAYGKKVQYILFGGYVKNFGTIDDLVSQDKYYFSKNSSSKMTQMWRLTPTVIWNIGKFALGLEYEVTSVQYGSNLDSKGLAQDDLHWITNNRVQGLVKFTF